jgi:hypothetical protein
MVWVCPYVLGCDEKNPSYIQVGTGHMVPRYTYNELFTIRFPDKSMEKWVSMQQRWGTSLVHRYMKNETQSAIYGDGIRRKLGFNLGLHTTVFQAEIYAIKACEHRIL